MPTCPYCKKEIHYLINEQSGTVTYVLYSDGRYEDAKNEFFVADGRWNVFNCPQCNRTITDDEGEALDFLNGQQA